MLINELSKISGISAFTIRYYEKIGLIKGSRNNGIKTNNYLHYNNECLEKLELIRDAKSIGFTLVEIKNLIDAWYSKKFTVAKKIEVLEEKLQQIDEKIKQLKEVKKVIGLFKKEVLAKDC
jgi:MerR family transcriptional regulator, copper efflux regulator